MSPIDSKPSRNEEEYFARENAERVRALRAKLDDARLSDERKSHIMRCPRCGGHLRDQMHQSVRIEVCADCGGTWLDKGELAILEAHDTSHLRRFMRDVFGVRDE